MPLPDGKTPASPGNPGAAEIDVGALFEELQETVRRVGPGGSAEGATAARLNARATAERLWRVTADRPPAGRGGVAGALQRPVKLAVRKLVRWYVEPALADQRAFNAALLRLVDDLHEENRRLRDELGRGA